jgi:hypothetical protein
MVHVAVRQQYFFDLGAHLGYSRLNPIDITARVNNRGKPCRFAFDDGAILLVGSNRHHCDR